LRILHTCYIIYNPPYYTLDQKHYIEGSYIVQKEREKRREGRREVRKLREQEGFAPPPPPSLKDYHVVAAGLRRITGCNEASSEPDAVLGRLQRDLRLLEMLRTIRSPPLLRERRE